jgi:tRNA threonylcarbamoyl adenosine modification protein (Sua5/YciO/YrdC/YwlC family)
MAQVLTIHPDNPQARHIRAAAEAVRQGKIIVYPTDSGYALGWRMDNLKAPKTVAQLRQLEAPHFYSILVNDLSQINDFALMDNVAFRLIKTHTPGPYTFILPATRRVPKKLQHQKRRTIGVRLPDHAVVHDLIEALGEPLMSSSLELPDADMLEMDARDIDERIGHAVDIILDSGFVPPEPSTVVDLADGAPVVLREGKGVVDFV